MASEKIPLQGESRWPVLAAMAISAVLPIVMPAGFVPGPGWLLPVVVAVLAVAVAVNDPGRIDRRSRRMRGLRLVFISVVAFGVLWGTVSLVLDLFRSGPETSNAADLLRAGALVWIDSILAFAFLYWELDGGGPGERAHVTPDYPDLAFPQHLNPDLAPPGWRPEFPDYFYLGLTNALAFSPTDVMPMSHWAKVTMGLQSLLSLLIMGLVVARAINVLA